VSNICLRLSSFKNIFHLSHGEYLVVSTEAKSIMKAVGEVRSHIGGDEPLPLDLIEIHVPQPLNDLAARVLLAQLLLQESVDHQRDKTCNEMRRYPVVAAEVYRPIGLYTGSRARSGAMRN